VRRAQLPDGLSLVVPASRAVAETELPADVAAEAVACYDRVYAGHRASITARAGRRLSNPRDVEDVVQEAFLRLFMVLASRPELHHDEHALAYCRRIVDNLCIDRHRASARAPMFVDVDEYVHQLPSDEDITAPVVGAEDAELVRHALDQLAPLHRQALIAREVDEKPLGEIADELGIERSSVKHVLTRARRALRRLLAGTSVDPMPDSHETGSLATVLDAATKIDKK
jgi:RNA polymerase sigma-70 factor (ECF subfamily)